jgi:cytosine/adenosine deaminase-related metal-dependent hydrolase
VKKVICAEFVATMAGPVMRDGAIVIDGGVIVDVGGARAMRAGHPDAERVEHGHAIILPGLVNAHTHLELTGVGQLPGPRSFVDWVIQLRRRLGEHVEFERFVRESTLAGIEQCRWFGVTSVGDITLNPAITRPLLRAAGLSGVSFGEVLGMAGRRGQFEGRLAAAMDRAHEGGGLIVGIEPHAPYSIDLRGYRRCVEEAAARAMPLATHLAETADEAEFLADASGEFARLWEAIGDWKAAEVPRFEGGPIRAMESVGLLAGPALLAHVNYASDEDLAVLAKGRASVVYCPRTHAYFGHPPHRFTEMLDLGINVALGTDSAASAGDLNLLEEVRLVHRLRPEVTAQTLFEMVTWRGAKALGMEGLVGRLAPAMRANYCVFGVSGDDPLGALLEGDAALGDVGIAIGG